MGKKERKTLNNMEIVNMIGRYKVSIMKFVEVPEQMKTPICNPYLKKGNDKEIHLFYDTEISGFDKE